MRRNQGQTVEGLETDNLSLVLLYSRTEAMRKEDLDLSPHVSLETHNQGLMGVELVIGNSSRVALYLRKEGTRREG